MQIWSLVFSIYHWRIGGGGLRVVTPPSSNPFEFSKVKVIEHLNQRKKSQKEKRKKERENHKHNFFFQNHPPPFTKLFWRFQVHVNYSIKSADHLITRGPWALTVPWVSETLHWLLVRRTRICISTAPS